MIKSQWKYKSLLIALLLVVGVFLMSGSAYAEGYKEKDDLFPQIEGFEHPPLSNFEWDTKGWTSAWDPLNVLCNVLFLLIVFLVRFGLMILDFGMNPTFFEDFITFLWKIVQDNVWDLVIFLLPLTILIGVVFVIRDYNKGQFQTMVKRFVTFLIACGCLALFLSIGVRTIVMVNDAVDELTKAVAGEFAGERKEELGPGKNFYGVIWEQMIYTPFAIGEVLEPKLTLTSAEASKINSEISPYRVSTGDEWATIILKFPKASDERKEILDVFEENHKELQVVAFNAGDRFFIVLVCLLASLSVIVFSLFFGIILIILFFYFVGVLAGGMIIIPLSFVPSEAPILLKNWAKQIVAPLVSKIAVGIYVGFVFLLTGAMIQSMAGNVLTFIVSMLFMSLILLASIVIFFFLLAKFGYKIFAPINIAVNPMRKFMRNRVNRVMRNKRINRRIKNAKDYDDDDEDDNGDEEEVVAVRYRRVSGDRVNTSNSTSRTKRASSPPKVIRASNKPADSKKKAGDRT